MFPLFCLVNAVEPLNLYEYKHFVDMVQTNLNWFVSRHIGKFVLISLFLFVCPQYAKLKKTKHALLCSPLGLIWLFTEALLTQQSPVLHDPRVCIWRAVDANLYSLTCPVFPPALFFILLDPIWSCLLSAVRQVLYLSRIYLKHIHPAVPMNINMNSAVCTLTLLWAWRSTNVRSLYCALSTSFLFVEINLQLRSQHSEDYDSY